MYECGKRTMQSVLSLYFLFKLMIPKIKVKKMEQAKYPTRSRGIIVKYSKGGYVTFPIVIAFQRSWMDTVRLPSRLFSLSWIKKGLHHLRAW